MMDGSFLSFGFDSTANQWMKIIIDMSLKSSLLILLFGLLALFLRRSTASLRSLIWLAALGVLILLPAMYQFTPIFNVPLLPDLGAGGHIPTPAFPAGSQNPAAPLITASRPDLANLPFVLWSAGALGLVLWMLIGRIAGWLLVAKATPVHSNTWIKLLNTLKLEMGIEDRPVRLMLSGNVAAAINTGILQSTIVLPHDADIWPRARREVVLLHELAHIQRRDTFFEVLAKAALIIYWFNPLVWLAVFRFRSERERACDDFVLNSGTKASDYAWQLMNIATAISMNGRTWSPMESISLGSRLKDRLLRILNPRIKRQGVRPAVGIALLIPVVLASLSLTSISPWESDAMSVWGANFSSHELIRDLSDEDPATREEALRIMQRDWERIADRLVEDALNLGNPKDRDRVIDTLASISRVQVLEILMDIYRRDSQCTRSIEQYNRLTNSTAQETTPMMDSLPSNHN